MPKARESKELSNDGVNMTIEVEVGERGQTKTTSYTIPATADRFMEYILGLDGTAKHIDAKGEATDETEKEYAYRMFTTSVERAAKAAVYQSLAQESTFITVGKQRIDILSFPVVKLVKAHNEYLGNIEMRAGALEASGMTAENALEAAEKSVGFGPWKTAAKRLVEDNKATLQADGTLVAV